MRRIARRVHVQFEWKLLPLVIISIIFLMNYTEYCPTYGIPFSQEHQKVNMYLFRGWIVAMSIPLVWNCGYIIRIRKLYPFLLIRLCNRTICFFYEVHKCLIVSSIWGLLLLFLGFNYSPLQISVLDCVAEIFNHCLWSSVFLVFYLLSNSPEMSCVGSIGLISISFFLGEQFPMICRYLPSSWGMIIRFTPYSTGGFSACYSSLYSLISLILLLLIGIQASKDVGDKIWKS